VSLKRQKQSTPANGKRSQEQALNNEWQRIVKLQGRNQRLEEDMKAFEQTCMETLRADEEHFSRIIIGQTRQLSNFLTRKSLAKWQRSELIDWIQENLELLVSSPFTDREAFEALLQYIADLEMHLQPPGRPESDTAPNGCDAMDAAGDDNDDLFAESDDIGEDDLDDSDLEADLRERLFAEFQRFEEEFEQEQQAERARQKSLQDLLKQSSINTLFRRLARRLHPDREQNPELKQLRGEQMGRAAHARDNRDLFTLFSMYEEHVGESPLASLGDSKEVLKLLKAHAQELRVQREEIIHDSPLRSHFYERFYDSKTTTRQHKLRQHCDMIRRQAEHERSVTVSIRSIATLKPYLEARYDAALIPLPGDIYPSHRGGL